MGLWNRLKRFLSSDRGSTATLPEFATTLMRLLPKLDRPAPALTGIAPEARQRLSGWRSSEKNLRAIAAILEQAGDPKVADAWLKFAQTFRYQQGYRDATLTAYVEALYFDRTNVAAWRELIDYSSYVSHVPTLASLFARTPLQIRPTVRPLFEAFFTGHNRSGVTDPEKAGTLKAALLKAADDQNDQTTIAYFAGVEALKAEKAGDLTGAVAAWTRAIEAGPTDPAVIDRYTIWLVKEGEYDQAAPILRQALADPPSAKTVRERLEKRMARCEKEIARNASSALLKDGDRAAQ
jgi:tetratricopeptide (TPR) repeat protein